MFQLATPGRLLIVAFTLSLILGPTSRLNADDDGMIDLAGTWKFFTEKGFKRGEKGDISKGFHEPAFDDSQWRDLLIGSNWESQGVAYDGIAWYRRQCTIPASWEGRKLILQLGSPDDGAEIYLNGKSLGTWKFTEGIFCTLPDHLIAWGKTNTIAIRVWDWYKNGGMGGTDFNIQTIRPFDAGKPNGQAVMDLSITRDLPEDVLASKRWEQGWRDGGTSDTRPKISRIAKAFRGQDAITLDVWYPNSAEYMDAILPSAEKGNIWQGRNDTFLAFWYRTKQLNGNMTLQLNTGKHVWGKRSTLVWEANFPVRPSSTANDGWQQVVIPFNFFTRHARESTFDDILRLDSTQAIERLVIGYGNHMLQSPGTIDFAGFQVGHAVDDSPFLKPIALDGLWRYKADNIKPDGSKSLINVKEVRENPDKISDDNRGYGTQLGYQKADFDDSSWDILPVGGGSQIKNDGNIGPAWYRQQVIIPTQWQGHALSLKLGNPHDTAELYFNGQLVAQTTENEAALETVIKPEAVRMGKPNQIAIKVVSWRKEGNLDKGLLCIGVADQVMLKIAHKGRENQAIAPDTFEMGVKPAKELSVVLQWAGNSQSRNNYSVHYDLEDCFHRLITRGSAPLKAANNGMWQAVLSLNESQTNQLYYAQWFKARVHVLDDKGQIVGVQTFPNADQKHFKLMYAQRDDAKLPILKEQIEKTPYGDLKLVDVIDCAASPNADAHPYMEGGIRNSWVKLRAYGTWQQGVSIESFKDRQYRQVNNNEFFAYRVGRGTLAAHKAYVLRVLVPDDKVRYQVMEIKTGRNYQGTGFRSGISKDSATDNFPLTQTYQWYDHIILNDETTYGYQGDKTISSENGFWVVFHDNGRAYTGQYKAGPAAAEIRLYELPDDDSALPAIIYPEKLPRRVLMMDWERQPEAPPADTVQYARLMGMNAIGPVFQKWATHGFWESKTGFAPPGWYKAAPEGERDEDVYSRWLDATRKANLRFIPRIEYGGGPNLPKEAWVIGPNGKVDPCGRYCRWGANILHPATWEELKTVIDELIGQHIQTNPQLAGLLWRQRQDRIKCSFGPDDVALFCKETNRPMPSGDEIELAKWASTSMKEQYHAWWQEKRANFLRKVRDHLKSYRNDLVLYYYNWDSDGWRPGLEKNTTNTPEDWSNLYNVDRAYLFWEQYEKKRQEITDDYYVNYVQKSNQPHLNIFPNLFANDQDIVIFAPVHWQYLANNAPYINYFATGDGLGICNMFSYEEKGRWNLPNDRYESSEMTPGGKDFGMAYMVESFFHGDPNVITTTTYTYGQGWADVHRRFAQAFLALPDQRGQIVTDAQTQTNDDVRVRRYDTANGTYLSVVSRAMESTKRTIRMTSGKAVKVTDLVTGQIIPSRIEQGRIVFDVDMTAMSLNSYLMQ